MKKFKETWIQKLKEKRQFKKDMKNWINLLAKLPKNPLKKDGRGISKLGQLAHKVNIKNVGEISTSDPIFIKEI